MRKNRVIVDHLQPGVVRAPVMEQLKGLGEDGAESHQPCHDY